MSSFTRLLFGATAAAAAGSAAAALSRGGGVAAAARCEAEQSDNPRGGRAAEHEWRKTWNVDWVEDWDSPKTRALPSLKGARRQLIMVRHGQYENEGQEDDSIRRLTPLGERQARETGRYLRKALGQSALLHATELSAVHVSDLQRARQTCDLILEAFGGAAPQPSADRLLREIFPCDPEPPYKAATAKPEDEKTIEEAFCKYFHRPTAKGQTAEMIVAHGNVIRYFVCRALQVPPEAWLRFSLAHCSLTVASVRGNGYVSVQQIGAASHLPSDMQTVMNVT